MASKRRRLNDRLQELERRAASGSIPAGLTHFYELASTVDAAGGAREVLERFDTGAASNQDRAAAAAVPGGIEAIRRHVDGLQHFYGGAQ